MHFNKGAAPQLTAFPKVPKKLHDGENNNPKKLKCITMTQFFMDVACAHLAKVTGKGGINIARFTDNN